MRTQGEIEAAVCEAIAGFEQDYMGRGPTDIHAYLFADLLFVRLKGVLTIAEQQLAASLPAEKGRDLLKQVRNHLVETARPVMEAMIQEIAGVRILRWCYSRLPNLRDSVKQAAGRQNHRSYSGFVALCSNPRGDSFWYRRERRGKPRVLAFSVASARMRQSWGVLRGEASRDAVGWLDTAQPGA